MSELSLSAQLALKNAAKRTKSGKYVLSPQDDEAAIRALLQYAEETHDTVLELEMTQLIMKGAFNVSTDKKP